MTEIGLGGAQPAGPARRKPRPEGSPLTEVENLRAQLEAAEERERASQADSVDSRHAPVGFSGIEAAAAAAAPPPIFSEQVAPPVGYREGGAVNPYAPTGWRQVEKVEFDLQLPSGQLARMFRLERDDVINLGLMEYLDTFTPVLLEQNISDSQREAMAQDLVKDDPSVINKLFQAVDKVVMACCLRPKVTDDIRMVYVGTPQDWANPEFTATVHIRQIQAMDRMALFNAAFGRSMDDLKSVWAGQAPGLAGVADNASVPPDAQ